MSSENTHIDTELVSLLQTGDHKAFEDIYNLYWDKLYFLAYKHLRSTQASEEIVQDVFFTLWRKRAELNIDSLPFYLSAMVRHAIYRFMAKEKKEQEKEFQFLKISKTDFDGAGAVEEKQLLELIQKLANSLPEKCRLVFIHNKLLDQTLSEVAAHLGISQKTAEAHLTKALKHIRANLGDTLSLLFIV